jgi:hypothetical protein
MMGQVRRAPPPSDEPTKREVRAVFVGLMIVLGLVARFNQFARIEIL